MMPTLRHLRRAVRAAACLALFCLPPACLLPDYEAVGGAPVEALGSDDTGCCSVTPGSGCADTVISECVCAVDVYCCESEWDDVCANQVAELGCGSCGGAGAAVDTGVDPEEAAPDCATDDDCIPDAPLCVGGFCVQCQQDAHCNAIDVDLPFCGAEGYCGECAGDSHCATLYGDEYPRCRVGLCVECATDAECGAGLQCIEGTCG